ncbi:hypothetical protein J4233_04945 [Candidatus Pacearchaeota archaeon]|nr:hypothetical protein [Candidatus Pacearchaeota archaeon]
MDSFDFYIPGKYRGCSVSVPRGTREPFVFTIPRNAWYLTVNPLEDEEEFLGCQGDSDRQELSFYDETQFPVDTQDVEHQILTFRLMRSLEAFLEKMY